MKARIGNVEFDVETKQDLELLIGAKIIDEKPKEKYRFVSVKKAMSREAFEVKLNEAIVYAHDKGISYSTAFKKYLKRRIGGAEIRKMKKMAEQLGYNPKDVLGKRGKSLRGKSLRRWTAYEDAVIKNSVDAQEAYHQLRGARTIISIYVRRNTLGVSKR